MVSVRPSSYGCTREVTNHKKKRLRSSRTVGDIAEYHSSFSSAYQLLNQLFYNTDIILSNFSKPHRCIHKIMELTDDMSKLLACNCMTLLAVLNGINSFDFCRPWARGGLNLSCDAGVCFNAELTWNTFRTTLIFSTVSASCCLNLKGNEWTKLGWSWSSRKQSKFHFPTRVLIKVIEGGI